ncbi:MAG: matrixin family metalloprotease [Patescibacteria group bacterium]
MTRRNTLTHNLLIILVIAAGFYFHKEIQKAGIIIGERTGIIAPCSWPITYRIGTVDKRFGLSPEQLLSTIKTAEAMWEDSAGKNLFEYSPDGEMPISLIYDYRQGTTDTLSTINSGLIDEKQNLEKLRARHAELLAEYTAAKSALNKKTDAYTVRRQAYETTVASYKNSDHVSRAEAQQLEEERLALNAEIADINQDTAELKKLVTTLNNAADELNQAVKAYNAQVGTYNKVGTSIGKEFDEGEYTQDENGARITIYQFENQSKLARVLTHELGHARGLGHVDNPKAIMYRLNIGTNETLAAEDIAELKAVCK